MHESAAAQKDLSTRFQMEIEDSGLWLHFISDLRPCDKGPAGWRNVQTVSLLTLDLFHSLGHFRLPHATCNWPWGRCFFIFYYFFLKFLWVLWWINQEQIFDANSKRRLINSLSSACCWSPWETLQRTVGCELGVATGWFAGRAHGCSTCRCRTCCFISGLSS